MVRSIVRRIATLILAGVLALGALTPAFCDDNDSVGYFSSGQKVVRVGWEESIFNTTGENGYLSGYDYDYRQDIASYTGWIYEYVYGTWSELLDMLIKGDIDLLYDVSITEERKNHMLFSAESMGSERYRFFIDPGNKKYDPEDLSTFQGARIACEADSILPELVLDWAKKNSVFFEIVEVSGGNDIPDMLERGEVDIAAGAETNDWKELETLLYLGESNYYYAINKERPDLKADLDHAQARLLLDNPFYNLLLYEKYMKVSVNSTLTSEELNWLYARRSIRIGYKNNNLAFCDYDEEMDMMIGALSDYLKAISKVFTGTTLTFEPIPFDNLEDAMNALSKGDIDCIFPIYYDRHFADTLGVSVTANILQSAMIAITPKRTFDENAKNIVAIEKNELSKIEFVKVNYPNWTIITPDSTDGCFSALERGIADCIIYSNYRINHVLPPTTSHHTQIVLSKQDEYAFGVSKGETALLSMLNHAIMLVPPTVMSSSLSKYSVAERKITFQDFVRDNAMAVIITLIAFFLTISAIAMFMIVDKQQRLKESLEVESVRKANEAKSAFLNNMSHDIRTPMNGINGMLEIIKRNRDDQTKVDDCLAKIEIATDHLTSLVNDVLDMSKLESGEMTLESVSFSIKSLFGEVMTIIQPQMDKEGIESSTIAPFIGGDGQNSDIFVIGSPLHVREILINIYSNAIKYNRQNGSVHTTIEYLNKTDDSVTVSFKIKDSGIGMSQEFIDNGLFVPFSQERGGARTKYKGTGLGMPIVKQLTDKMGGTINVISREGVGTEFTLKLPFKIDKTAANEGQIGEAEHNLSGKTVLVAEDNELNREIVVELLSELGVKSVGVCDGKEAISCFANSETGQFSAILMDIMMPEMNGYDAAREIRAMKREDSATIPIIAMTANAFIEDKQAALDAGMNAHIPKPISLPLLIETLSKLIK